MYAYLKKERKKNQTDHTVKCKQNGKIYLEFTLPIKKPCSYFDT